MSIESGAADQMLRMELAITESVLRLAAKGSVHLVALLVAVLRNQKQITGKTNIQSMIAENKPLTTFPLDADKMRDFHDLAKQYGMMFSIVRDPQAPETVDVIIKQEDAGLVNQILQKIGAEIQVGDEKNAEAGLSESALEKSELTTSHRPASTMITTEQLQKNADTLLARLQDIRTAWDNGAPTEQCRTALHTLLDELGDMLGLPPAAQTAAQRAAQMPPPVAPKEQDAQKADAAKEQNADGKPSVRDRIEQIKDRMTYEGQHQKQPQQPQHTLTK